MTYPDPHAVAPSPSVQHAIASVHASYRGVRTKYTPPDELLADTVTEAQLKPHLWRLRATFGVTFVVWLCGAVLLLCAAPVAPDYGSLLALVIGGAALVTVVVWMITLFTPLREPIAEYSLLIEGRSEACQTAYWWIWWALRQRRGPFLLTPVRYGRRYLLAIRSGRTRSFVVVRPYGSDLYVGWTMWRARSTTTIVSHLFRDRVRLFGGGTEFRSAIRGTNVRALREMTHSVTREGVQAAILNQPLSQQAWAELGAVPDQRRGYGERTPGGPVTPPRIVPAVPYSAGPPPSQAGSPVPVPPSPLPPQPVPQPSPAPGAATAPRTSAPPTEPGTPPTEPQGTPASEEQPP